MAPCRPLLWLARSSQSVLLGGCLLAMLASPEDVRAQCVSLTTMGSPFGQNFDTLSNTAGSTTNNLTITGWFMTESGGGARDNEQYAVDTGGSNTGDTYSYGAAAATDRALGGLRSGTLIPIFGACFTNNTGSTVTNLGVAYTGEEWRLGTAARTDQINFEYSLNATDLVTGTWTGVAALNFITPNTVLPTGAKDGNLAGNRTALATTISSLSIANGATFWIRWTDTDASGADDGLSVDDFSLTPSAVAPPPTLNISDVTQAEGDPPGTTTFTFAVTLTAPAGAGGVTFDIGTQDNTATTADNDYVVNTLTGQSIPMGSTGPYNFNVTVNRDLTTEANETFFVNVTNVTGATVGDGQGLGTINNDDVTLTPIHDIQGPGASSPIVGSSVTTRGIVTGVKSNGFFIQEPDATVDADPATSEGILVFGSPVPAAAVVGALVQVTGTVAEFVPSQDPLQPPLSELTGATTIQISTGNPLPAPIPLTASFPDPAGPHDQLERLEGMRVSVASLTVVGPTLGNVSEPNATATSSGVFYGVITGHPTPFREPGIQAPDPAPSGTIPPIPRWDHNPELIRVDSDSLVGGPLVDVSTTAVVTGLIGPLDYTFRYYTIAPDPGASIGVAGGMAFTAVTPPTAQEFTVATYNVERFFDTVNDPGIGEPVLTPAAFDVRLNKLSLGIRNSLRAPDIIGMVEVENLSTLQALAARISADAIAAAQPDPEYDAFLVEGNDVGGIDVGFLVKTAVVAGATPRVEVVAVTQELDGTLFVNPDTSTETLNDRPPLLLEAIVHHPNGASFPVTVIVNHMRSLNGQSDPTAGSNGWATGGERVRAKRQAQAEDLANLIQARQIGDPTERIIVIGDFNAFEFNDGYGDSMNVITGTPPPDNETVVPGDGVDLVNTDFDNIFDTLPATQRYSFVFDGSHQSLDHILINAVLDTATLVHREEHPRINADFPETARNDGSTAVRLSDHDPVIAYFQVAGFASADLSISKDDNPDPLNAGTNLTYTIGVTNSGPDPADAVEWTDTLPAGTTFVSLSSPGGWSCTTPPVGSGGTVECSTASLAVSTANFTLTVAVAPSVASGTVLSNTAAVTSTTADPDPMDNSDTETTTVGTSANLSVTKTDSPDPVTAGNNLTYTITVTNAGPSNAATVALADTLPAGTTFVSMPTPGGWSCTTGATINCSIASLPAGSTVFTLTVQVGAGVATGTVLSNTATVTSATPDPTPGNESATATTTVSTSADLSVTKTDSPDPVSAGANLTYTITVTNAGPSNAATVSLNDTLPAGTTFQSLAAEAGWSCVTPAVGAGGLVTCSIASMAPGAAVFTLVVNVDAGVPGATVLSNTATVTSPTPDPDSGDLSSTATTTVTSAASLTATKTVSGTARVGGTITYTIVLTNGGPAAQGDNPGDELFDQLPPELDLVSANATSGTVVADTINDTVSWNGSLAAMESVTITITTTVLSGNPGDVITNQAAINYDADGNGSNESSGVSDDPGVAGGGDPTGIQLVAGSVVEIPTVNEVGLALLALVMAMMAARVLGRRRLAGLPE